MSKPLKGKPSDYVRCFKCRRYLLKSDALVGPGGMLLGADCYRKVVAQEGK
jgi:hypothetical protein